MRVGVVRFHLLLARCLARLRAGRQQQRRPLVKVLVLIVRGRSPVTRIRVQRTRSDGHSHRDDSAASLPRAWREVRPTPFSVELESDSSDENQPPDNQHDCFFEKQENTCLSNIVMSTRVACLTVDYRSPPCNLAHLPNESEQGELQS